MSNYKYLYILPLIYIFLGCSTTVPAISEYKIKTDVIAKQFPQSGCKKESLKIAQAFSSSNLMTRSMGYGQGDYKQFSFSESQWAESPNRTVTSEILAYVNETGLFNNVQTSKSRSENGLLLETNIEEFMQYFSEDAKESYVNVVITLTLIDTKTNKVLSAKSFDRKVEVSTMNAEGGVIALNKALNDVIVQSGEWLGSVCK